MKTANIIISILLLLMCGCSNPTEKTNKETALKVNPDGTVTKKTFRKNGTLLSETTLRNDTLNGVAKNYYENGKVSYEFFYVNGKRERDVKWFFSDGKICSITPYKNNKRQGIEKRFYRSGKVAAEIPYSNGNPAPGLKEYTEDGKLVVYNPSIIIRSVDQTAAQHKFILRLTLSDNNNTARFFILKDNGSEVKRQELPSKNGTGEMIFKVSQSNFNIGKIYFEAQAETKYMNSYVCRTTYRR